VNWTKCKFIYSSVLTEIIKKNFPYTELFPSWGICSMEFVRKVRKVNVCKGSIFYWAFFIVLDRLLKSSVRWYIIHFISATQVHFFYRIWHHLMSYNLTCFKKAFNWNQLTTFFKPLFKRRYRISMQIWIPEIFSKIIIFSHNTLKLMMERSAPENKNVY
jgi:hypothetical protein